MSSKEKRRYNMYPQKEFAGHVETEVQEDGRIKYTFFEHPYDGVEEARSVIIDPSNEEEMRGVRQLHLVPDIREDPHSGGYIMDIDAVKEFFSKK